MAVCEVCFRHCRLTEGLIIFRLERLYQIQKIFHRFGLSADHCRKQGRRHQIEFIGKRDMLIRRKKEFQESDPVLRSESGIDLKGTVVFIL